MAFSIKFDDRQGIRRKLQKMMQDTPREVSKAVRMEAEIEATESKRRTPVDLGNLKASIHVEGPEISGNQISATIAAGGPAAPYAVYVHEDLSAYHKVGQAKFIESTLKESAPFLPARIAKRLRDSLLSRAGR